MSISKGGRNLILMAVGAILIAGVNTAVALAIYHYSGDIYIDRSRPGYLPDEEEADRQEEQKATEYIFSDTGEINDEVLTEFVSEYAEEAARLDEIENPFDPEALSDEKLGISGEAVTIQDE
jgi:hypothetical protein